MRSIFLILGLLLTLGIVAVVAKKQLGTSPPPTTAAPVAQGQTLRDSSPQAIQQQFKQSLDTALQPARREPD